MKMDSADGASLLAKVCRLVVASERGLGREDAEGEFGIEWVAEAQELESLATRGGCQQEIEF